MDRKVSASTQNQALAAGIAAQGLLLSELPMATPSLRQNFPRRNRILSALARGDKPRVRIEGDVQLAAEVNWLIDNVRWDAEEDLARLIGDAPAHTLAVLGRQALAAMRSFVASKAPAAAGGAA